MSSKGEIDESVFCKLAVGLTVRNLNALLVSFFFLKKKDDLSRTM